MSTTVAPVTVLGPLLVTTIVYVRLCPGTAVVTPSVLVISRSALAINTVLLSVFDVRPSIVAEAVLVTEPAATSDARIVYVAVQVMVSPGSR